MGEAPREPMLSAAIAGPRRYLALFLLCSVLGGAAYLAALQRQIGAPIWGHHWMRDMRVVKRHLAGADAGGPRILLQGGSSALFGFDSELITRRSGRQTFNLAIHGDLPPDYLYGELLHAARGGDTAILALELNYYFRDTRYTPFIAEELMVWGGDYIAGLDVVDRLRLFGAVRPRRALAGLLSKGIAPSDAAAHGLAFKPEEEILAGARRAVRGELPEHLPDYYTYWNLNGRGDYVSARAHAFHQPSDYSLSVRQAEREGFWEGLAVFGEECRRRGVRPYLTWPPTIRSGALDAANPVVRDNLERIRARALRAGVPMIGELWDYNRPIEEFHDTLYHMTHVGQSARTERFVAVAARELGISDAPR